MIKSNEQLKILLSEHTEEQKKGDFRKIYIDKTIFINSILFCVTWNALDMGYLCMTFAVETVYKNIYTSMMLFGIFEAFWSLIAGFLLTKYKTRTLLKGCLLLVGVPLTLFFFQGNPKEMNKTKGLTFLGLGLISKSGMEMS